MEPDETNQLRLLTEEYLPRFLAFAVANVSPRGEAEELAQEIAYRCVEAIRKGRIRDNFNAYCWSVAYRTCRDFYRYKYRTEGRLLQGSDEPFTNVPTDEPTPLERVVEGEEKAAVRVALSRLWGYYREALVLYYYREMPIRAIAKQLSLGEEMVKYYLRAGRRQLKEVYDMNDIGIKSIVPAPFSIYKSALDFSKVNVWEVFRRRLPGQIALFCHDGPKTVREISVETGVPAVYIEEEVTLLLEAGVMVPVGKNKYRANFHILRAEARNQVVGQIRAIHEAYAPAVEEAFRRFLPEMKTCDIFRQEVDDNRYAWVFALNIPDQGEPMWIKDYPVILSCGSKAFIFAEEAERSPWAAGHTPTELENCVVWPADIGILGNHSQRDLWDRDKARALYDIYLGKTKEEDVSRYAELLAEGYAVRDGSGALCCNVAVMTDKANELFRRVSEELSPTLVPLCREAEDTLVRLVRQTIPDQLSEYAYGFASTWLSFYTTVILMETLYRRGFLVLPDPADHVPVACHINPK